MASELSHSPARLSAEAAVRRLPRWQQIQGEIESAIAQGKYAPGEQLPTEEELARRFHVHRHTVRRALERLRDKQVVRVEQGRGTFVREPALSYRIGRNTRLT